MPTSELTPNVMCFPGLLAYGSIGGSCRVAPGIMESSAGCSGGGVADPLAPLVGDVISVDGLSVMTSSALEGKGAPVAGVDVPAELDAFASIAGKIDITAVISLAAAPFECAEGAAGVVAVTTSGGFSAGVDVDGCPNKRRKKFMSLRLHVYARD
jgi:hypothetical protein